MLVVVYKLQALFNVSSQLSHILGMLNVDFQEFLGFILVVHDREFLGLLNLDDRFWCLH